MLQPTKAPVATLHPRPTQPAIHATAGRIAGAVMVEAVVTVEAAVATEPTVILRTPPPKPSIRQKASRGLLLGLIGGGLVGAVIGYAGAKFGANLLLPGLPKWAFLLELALLPAVWLLAVGVHEFGHLVGGWLGGGRFLLYAVGPFLWRRSPSGVNFCWNTNLNTAGGLAACLPHDPARNSPRRTAVMIAGGPVSSLLLVVVAAWLSAGFATIATRPALLFAQHFALFVAAVSFLIFLVTAFPGMAGGFKTDGLRCFELLRGDARSAQEAAVLALTTASLAGVRPGDYEPHLVERALSLRDGSLFDLYGHVTVVHHFLDLGQPARAQQLLDHALAAEEKLAPFVRDSIRCDYAWLLALHGGDAGLARAWLDSAGPLTLDSATRLRAEAAVLLAEGRKPEAAAKAREGLHAAEHKSLSPVKSAYTEETLRDLLQRAEARG